MSEPQTEAGKRLLKTILRDLYPPDAWADGKGERAIGYGLAIRAVEDEAAGDMTDVQRWQITDPHPQQDIFHAPGICRECDKARA